MIVSLTGFAARLAADAGTGACTLHVGPSAAAEVMARLTPGDWSYAFLRGACGLEIVKVVGAVGDTLLVYRGAAGTDRRAFAAGDTVEYGISHAEIQDRIAIGSLGLALTGADAVDVSQTGGEKIVTIPVVVIGARCAAQVVGETKIVIGQRVEAYGCCDVSIPKLPDFVYLTSKPYPVDVIDSLTTVGKVVSGRVILPPREAISMMGSVVSGQLRVLLVSYVTVDEAISTEGLVVSGELRVLLLQYGMVDEAISVAGLVVEGDLRVLLVQYPMVDEAIATTGLVVSGELVVI